MADFTYAAAFALAVNSPGSSSSLPVDEDLDNACSICLEPFTAKEPANVTSCKHEYHIQCILEWSQRSKECPVCWQTFILKDPASQELLDAVTRERCTVSWNSRSSLPRNSYNSHENFDLEQGFTYSDDSEERILQFVSETAGQSCLLRQRDRQNSFAIDTGVPLYASPTSSSDVHETNLQTVRSVASESDQGNHSSFSDTSLGFGFPLPVSPQSSPLLSGGPPVDKDELCKLRFFSRHLPHQPSRGRSRPEVLTFPESIKSKLSAASSRYKESFSKNSQGLKDKLLRNNSVKEFSKGVQREMNAGFLGFVRMVERLELASKRSTGSPSVPLHSEGEYNESSKGKQAEDAPTAQVLITKTEEKVPVVYAGSPSVSISSPVVAEAPQIQGPRGC